MKCLKLIICILVIALLSFSLISCNKQVATTITKAVEEITTISQTTMTVEAITTKEATTTTIDESNNYKVKMLLLLSEFSKSMGTLGQSFTNIGNGTVSIAQNKKDAANFIKDMNNIYNDYLSLTAPEKFKTSHELFGTAMDHVTNMDTYLQQYIDTENINNMTDYINKAISEMKMATEYIKKATNQINSLK